MLLRFYETDIQEEKIKIMHLAKHLRKTLEILEKKILEKKNLEIMESTHNLKHNTK